MATCLEYLRAAMSHANYEKIEGGRYFATIPEFEGLWAVGNSREDAEKELFDALDNWIDVTVKIGRERPPAIDGKDLFVAPKRLDG
ncbi:MAG: type II toxin-antitoxin system HicB family antitoxin [Candidatus Binataceae bacterium]